MANSLVESLTPTPEQVPYVERRMLGLSPVIFGPTDLTGASFSGAGYSIGGFSASSLPWAYWLESIIITSNKTVVINIISGTVSLAGTGTMPTSNIQQLIPANVPTVIPARVLLRQGSMSTLSAWLKEVVDADKTNTRVTISGTGFSFADDLDFAAPRTVLVVGDSLFAGTGPTVRDNFIPWKIRRYYTDKGARLRMINGAVPGSTSGGHELLRQNGLYDHNKVGLIVYQLGTNDAAQAIPAATTGANLATFIAWKKLRWPDAKMVVFGPPPAENNTTETALVAIRQALSDAVDAASDNNIKFKSLAGAFDRAAGTTNYVSTDTAGSRLHPNDTGILAEWNGGYAGFVGIKAWLDANMPTA